MMVVLATLPLLMAGGMLALTGGAARASGTGPLRLKAIGVKNQSGVEIAECTVRFVDGSFDEMFGIIGVGSMSRRNFPVARTRPKLKSDIVVEWTYQNGRSVSGTIDESTEVFPKCKTDDHCIICIGVDDKLTVESVRR